MNDRVIHKVIKKGNKKKIIQKSNPKELGLIQKCIHK